jgi:alcohol dehydrogenase (cytochrome c)
MIRTLIGAGMLVAAGCLSLALHAQQLTADPTKPPTDAWPTYHGDYKATHYSPLKQIDTANVHALSLAWSYRSNGSPRGAVLAGEGPDPVLPAAPAGRGFGGGGGGGGAVSGGAIKGIPLMVNGVLYLATTNNVYAVDARSGAEIWHFYWKSTGGSSGTRGVTMLGSTLFFQTGDEFVVAIDANTGKERWRKRVVQGPGYTNATTPLAVKGHVILGVGGDRQDIPAWVESRDPETGELQWKWNVTPRKGEPGIDTWPSEDAAIHGGGGPWQPFTYDAELNNVIVTTANPNPVLNGLGRPGTNLYTSSIVALNADTGKMQWYFQASPHDVHDWDATQTVMLFERPVNGQPRKLAAQFSRNGWLFVLDRTTGKAIVSKRFINGPSAYKGVDEKGQPIPDPEKEPTFAGSLVSPDSDGAANYPSPSYNPDLGLVFVNASEPSSIFYLTENDDKAIAWGGASEAHVGSFPSALRAFDVGTGNLKWEHKYEGNGFWSSSYPGTLSTGGGLVFTGDPAGNFVAFDATNGKSLWHFPLGGVLQSNAPNTFTLDGRQYVLVAGGDTLYAFYLQ